MKCGGSAQGPAGSSLSAEKEEDTVFFENAESENAVPGLCLELFLFKIFLYQPLACGYLYLK